MMVMVPCPNYHDGDGAHFKLSLMVMVTCPNYHDGDGALFKLS
jgi:hypothetical protein